MTYKHKFTRPGKQAAFETAQAFASDLTDDELLEWGLRVHTWLTRKVRRGHPDLPKRDAEHVAGAALREERGERQKHLSRGTMK